MPRYFYDQKNNVVLRLDSDTLEVEVMPELERVVPLSAPPPAAVVKTPPPEPAKRQYTKREAVAPPKAKGTGCPECGSPSRHKKDCSKAGTKTHPFTAPSPRRIAGMSQMTFGRVKISQSHEVSAADIARNLDIDIAEVEKAFECEDYSTYQKA